MTDRPSNAPHKARAARRFNRWARSYEEDRRSRFNAALQTQALGLLDLSPHDRLLDIGCGTGAAVRCAAKQAARAVGIDIAPAMIERARQLAGDGASAEFCVADSEALPFADRVFTALLCTSSFHHYPDPRRALAEMARVLSSPGRLVIGDGISDRLPARIADQILRRTDHSHVRLYRSEELAALVEAAGFSGVHVTALQHGGYGLVLAHL